MENVAAIDIGSNAIRLVIGEYDNEHHTLRVVRKLRESLRLGKDVFASGQINEKTLLQAVQIFTNFRQILDAYNVKNFRAIATSALREASNQNAVVNQIKCASGIAIQVIDGVEEARLIHQAVSAQLNLNNKLVLLLDIGGGSVEITLSQNATIRATQSFPLGTVRILQKADELKLKDKQLKSWVATQFQPITDFIQKHTQDEQIDFCIGTGGNLEFLGKLRVQLLDKESTFSMRSKDLEQILGVLLEVSAKERAERFRMRPDRADVIIPAALVTQRVLETASTPRLMIPGVGLKDGILLEFVRAKTVRVVLV